MRKNLLEISIDEQRQATRFVQPPDSYFAVLNLGHGEALLGEVRDESLGGLGVLFRDDFSLNVGEQVELVYLGQLLKAEVRHLHRLADGMTLVGFSCQPMFE